MTAADIIALATLAFSAVCCTTIGLGIAGVVIAGICADRAAKRGQRRTAR